MKMQQILIIEDDISLNKGLCQALSSEDRQIFSCTNLQAARQQLACFKASLILLDITLPDGSGLDFLVEVKTDFPDIPVILLTANDTDFDIVSGLELGADDYITKPFLSPFFVPELIHSLENIPFAIPRRLIPL